MADATRSDRPATPASGKSLLHDVNEPDTDQYDPSRNFDWTSAYRSTAGAWWSRTGSNRRPQACKASALPTELRPRQARAVARGMSSVPIMVGLGRLELPTSRLSGVRSNHLSYRPPLFSVRSSKSPKRHSRMLQRDRLDEKEKRRRRHPALSFW